MSNFECQTCQIYMFQIILLILGQDYSFNASIHKLLKVFWY